MSEGKALTPFGVWMRDQPRGTLSRAQRKTGFAWTTVSTAQHELKSLGVATALSRFTRGAVKVAEILKPRADDDVPASEDVAC